MAVLKKRLWVSFGIIFGTIIVASAAVYYYAGEVHDEAGKIVVDRTLIAQQEAALSNLAALKQDAPKAAQYEAAINQLVPDQYTLITFSKWLTTIAQKYNVTAGSSFGGNPSNPGAGTPGVESFSLQAQGNQNDMVKFLQDIETESAGFLLSIDGFDFTTDGANSRITANGRLFFQ